jgi:hypothetical protein
LHFSYVKPDYAHLPMAHSATCVPLPCPSRTLQFSLHWWPLQAPTPVAWWAGGKEKQRVSANSLGCPTFLPTNHNNIFHLAVGGPTAGFRAELEKCQPNLEWCVGESSGIPQVWEQVTRDGCGCMERDERRSREGGQG